MRDIWKILKFSKKLWPYYVAISILSVLISAAGMLLPLITGRAITEIGKGTTSNIKYVFILAILLFVIDLFANVVNNIMGYLGDQMAVKLNKILSVQYYRHILSLPQQYFDTELSGKIINRLNRSIQQISSFMQMMSNNFLQFIFGTIFALAIVAYFSWQIALLLFSLYPIYIFMTIKTSGKWMSYQTKINKQLDIATGRFAEVINQIRVVKSYNQQKNEIGFFNGHINRVIGLTRPQSKLWHRRDTERRLVLNVIFFLVYVLIFVQGARGVFNAGQAVALILYAYQIRIPIFTISFLVENTQRAVADSKDYFAVMNIKPAISDVVDPKKLKVTNGEIKFDNVSFAYDKQKILRSIDLDIRKDSKIALVGESGAGKTTITNLLMRLYDPHSGTISIDDQNIALVSQRSLRQNIGVVFQEPALFSGTISENIAYSNPDAKKTQIIAAAKAANADEFISKLGNGYDSEIGERGLKLSGGQKQRIAIARAILKNAPILVLDEATSSLDSKSEHLVQEALNNLMKGRTTLIIAHRLTTIAHVDQIVTLKDGKIDEVGSPEELSMSGGIYSQLLHVSTTQGEKAEKRLKEFELSS
jgi:ATP-binding cassette subfamily B protein